MLFKDLMALNEKILVSELKSGNSKAFEKLFFHYFPRLYAYIHKITGNGPETEDLVQDVFVSIWNNKEQLDENRSFSGFIFKIARNKALNLIKQNLSRQIYLQYLHDENIPQPVIDYNAQEITDIIDKAVSSLPERTKEIFLLSRHEGLTYMHIARKLELSENVVDHEIRKALQKIKDILKAKDYL